MKHKLLLLLLLQSLFVFPQVKTVGPIFPACDYGEIQTAISIGNATEIRVVNGTYTENLSFHDSLIIKGGYATCADAISDTQGTSQATIDGSNQDFPVISMITSNSRSTITLENLIITNGNATTISGGGILLSNMDAEVTLRNVNVDANNSTLLGGGIAIKSNLAIDTDLHLINSLITNNNAIKGGGVYCSVVNGGASITLSNNSGISGNTSRISGSPESGRGGGLYLEGCNFTLYSGTAQLASSIGINSNIAEREGGGIYATLGAYVSLYGHANCSGGICIGDDDINPVNLTGNSATNGGALYLSGSSAYAEIFAGLINNNHSTSNGGAISVMDGAILDVRRVTDECWDKVRCNFFSGNTANGNGGAIYNESPNVNISNTYFEDNRANIGTAIYSTGSNTLIRIDTSVFNHNGNNGTDYADKYVIRAHLGANIDIIQSTIADNNATTAVLGVSDTSNTELKIYSSIVHDNSTGPFTDSTNLGSLIADCVIAHNLTSVGVAGAGIFIGDPQFIDRNNRDYHINPFTSPAIDRCSPPSTLFLNKDIDFTARGLDNPSIVNQFGPYDIGADETIMDIIFMDGFE